MLVAVAGVVVAGITLTSAKASLTADDLAIAKIGMPLGGGSIQSISVVTGPHSQPVPVRISGGKIWPKQLIDANQPLEIQVTVKRPGWISWLAGATQKLDLKFTTPVASLRSHYITVRNGQLKAHFKGPISAYTFGGSPGHMKRTVLPRPGDVLSLPHPGQAGTEYLSASVRTWEKAKTAAISYFPAGKSATAVASPSPGASIRPSTPITLTFSKPVSKALGGHMPPITPTTPGGWHQINDHTIRYQPTGYGYGLDAKVQIALPNDVRLLSGQSSTASNTGTWTVPGGSIERLQQLLAIDGYLPLTFHYASGRGPGLTAAAQETAAVDPPKGSFSWRYPNTPQRLKDMWQVGASGTMMEGAIMAFENDNGIYSLPYDGPTAAVWKTLIANVVAGKHGTFGYSFVDVSVGSQSLNLWHNGKTVIGGTPVNTGIPQAPTATGTYPVYEHLTSTTMSGTNPDGSHYSDPNIPDVSYFNGGDALHGFTRASYGSPQSLGCVEMPYSTAAQVFPYTPVGQLVDVHD
jgi:lipoprotein-anchoring transpeptidase ErfK/SrfK